MQPVAPSVNTTSPSVLPRDVLRRVGAISGEVQRVEDGRSEALDPLQDDLARLCREVRARHPLRSLATPELLHQARAVAEVHSLANRLAQYAAFAASGHPPAGVSLGVCLQTLDTSMGRLGDALSRAYAAPDAAAGAVTGATARPDLIRWVDVPAGAFRSGYDNAPARTGRGAQQRLSAGRSR